MIGWRPAAVVCKDRQTCFIWSYARGMQLYLALWAVWLHSFSSFRRFWSRVSRLYSSQKSGERNLVSTRKSCFILSHLRQRHWNSFLLCCHRQRRFFPLFHAFFKDVDIVSLFPFFVRRIFFRNLPHRRWRCLIVSFLRQRSWKKTTIQSALSCCPQDDQILTKSRWTVFTTLSKLSSQRCRQSRLADLKLIRTGK